MKPLDCCSKVSQAWRKAPLRLEEKGDVVLLFAGMFWLLSRLIDAVAASLAIGSLSLCLIVALTVFSIKVSMAMPVPA